MIDEIVLKEAIHKFRDQLRASITGTGVNRDSEAAVVTMSKIGALNSVIKLIDKIAERNDDAN